jgi:translation initiation factor 2B subunit (eIF-2B alpha/beta/delta family)
MTSPIDYLETTFQLSRDHAEQLCRIEVRVAKLWEANLSIPYFTTHGPIHNKAVIGLLTQLIPASMNTPAYELERYLLLVGAWLHDVGMLDLDFFTEQYRPSTVRGQHHDRSARWLVYHATELGLSAAEADTVAYLVKMHRKKEDLETCPDQMWIGSQKVRIRLMSALLRLADALHIDESRAPLQEYSLYRMTGMPAEAKFHWVKARAVQGIELNLPQGVIKVQIDIPEKSTEGEFRPLADFIRQEIESELETVRQTLAKEGCPFLMDVSVDLVQVPGLKRGSNRANEIDELNNLISIDVSPNARRLVTVILQSIKQINPETQGQPTAKHVLETLESLRDYVKDLVPKVVARRCHVAAVRAFVALVLLLKGEKPTFRWHTSLSLFTLLDGKFVSRSEPAEAKEQIESNLTYAIEQIVFPSDEEKCRDILQQINQYFVAELQQLNKAIENLNHVIDENGKSDTPILNTDDRILLYGTSASVIDLLETVSKVKNEMKECLEIFVAECRVKSNYATANIIFNDGIEYARRIAQIGYKKVAIVPDAAIAHLLLPRSYYEQAIEPSIRESKADNDNKDIVWLARSDPITKIFFGFNGLDLKQQFAVHSCGHLALTLLAKRPGDGGEDTSIAQVYLVGTTSKCGTVHYKHVESRSTKTWLTSDSKPLDGPPMIYDYNPVDDIIKLDLVDWIISDLGILSPRQFLREFKDYLKDAEKQFKISLG